MRQKLMATMLARNHERRLSGQVQIDDAHRGGERKLDEGGRRGRGSPNKLPFVAAVAPRDGKPVALHLRRVEGFTKEPIKRCAERGLAPGAEVVTDGLSRRCGSSRRQGRGPRPG
jgi:hypothetical protein